MYQEQCVHGHIKKLIHPQVNIPSTQIKYFFSIVLLQDQCTASADKIWLAL